MNEYEVLVEDINPCGGKTYAKKEIIEIEAESPKAYVQVNGRYPLMDLTEKSNGDTVITTGDDSGNMVRYTFTEC